jgi:hypothetical protein
MDISHQLFNTNYKQCCPKRRFGAKIQMSQYSLERNQKGSKKLKLKNTKGNILTLISTHQVEKR